MHNSKSRQSTGPGNPLRPFTLRSVVCAYAYIRARRVPKENDAVSRMNKNGYVTSSS